MTIRTPLTGPSVWLGRDVKDSQRWIRDLPASAHRELDAALQAVKAKGLDWSQITRADFPLPTLDAVMADVARELEDGCGMVKLRGFPVTAYDEDDLRKIYFGVGTHIGTPVCQNRSGELMRAIRDEGAHVGRTYGQVQDGNKGTFLSSYARTLTNGGLRFHTDRTDVVGLLCVRQARAGGVSKLASTAAIHNAILERRPDLKISPIRGNAGTRISKLAAGECDATLLGLAGLRRIGEERAVTSVLSVDEMLPAVSQGVIGIECRTDDLRTKEILLPLHHPETAACNMAERSLLGALGGSCRTPIAGLARLVGDMMSVRGLIFSPDGARRHCADRQGPVGDAAALGADAGAELRAIAGPNFFAALN